MATGSPKKRGEYTAPPRKAELTAVEVIALIVSLIWLVLSSSFFFLVDTEETGTNSLEFVVMLIAIFMPIGMFWVGALSARASKTMREESRRLETAITAMRQSYLGVQSNAPVNGVEKKLDQIAEAQRKAEETLESFSEAKFTSVRSNPEDKIAMPMPVSVDDQASLALGTPSESLVMPLSVADFIKALNFPETAEDKDGFRALKLALSDRKTGKLVEAAQDVLTLLSHDGIFMDDLLPDRAKPEVWRRFAEGERGVSVAALGGVRDRSSLALTKGRMKQDTEFRNAVHHFLRQFDVTFTEFAKTASDEEIASLAQTRTARAFMLLGRAAGIFN